MKRLSILLGIAVGFVAPFAAYAEQTVLLADTVAPPARTKTNTVVVTASAPRKASRTWYEVTNITAAGSHLPVVICHCDGLMYVVGGGAFMPDRAYRRNNSELGATGAASVGNELTAIDPAFVAAQGGGAIRH